MKADERRGLQRLLTACQRLLVDLNRMGPASEAPEDVDGFGEVKDYLLDRIEVCERRLGGAA